MQGTVYSCAKDDMGATAVLMSLRLLNMALVPVPLGRACHSTCRKVVHKLRAF